MGSLRLLLLLLHNRRYASASAVEDMVVSSLRLISSIPPATLPPDLHSINMTPGPTTALPPPPPPPPPPPTALLLSPADRLRGVFLRKPPTGRAALQRALSSSGLDAATALAPEVLSDVVNAGELGGAATVAFFDWAVSNSKPPPSVHTCSIVVRALGRKKFFEFLDDALEIMRRSSVVPDLTTLEIIIDSLVAARHVRRAVEVLRTDQFGFGIGKACSKKDALTILIRCLCRRSHVRLASSLLLAAREESLGLDNHAYNEVIGGWARLGRVDKLEHFWAKMQEDRLMPDEVSHCHRIEALGRAGKAHEAVKVFENMVQEGFGPSTMAYNAVIFNFVSIGDLDISMKYYKEMVDMNCPANIDTYHRLIRAFLRERRVADALQLFDDMLARGIRPDTGMITAFIEPLCTFGPPHAALMIYKKSRKAGCIVSLKAYKLLLDRLAKLGKSGTVLTLWEEMQEYGYPSDKEIYEFIVNGLCNVGKVDAAVSVVEESLRKRFCIGRVVYSKLNNNLLEMNKVETAYNLFKKVKEARARSNSHNYCRANVWCKEYDKKVDPPVLPLGFGTGCAWLEEIGLVEMEDFSIRLRSNKPQPHYSCNPAVGHRVCKALGSAKCAKYISLPSPLGLPTSFVSLPMVASLKLGLSATRWIEEAHEHLACTTMNSHMRQLRHASV